MKAIKKIIKEEVESLENLKKAKEILTPEQIYFCMSFMILEKGKWSVTNNGEILLSPGSHVELVPHSNRKVHWQDVLDQYEILRDLRLDTKPNFSEIKKIPVKFAPSQCTFEVTGLKKLKSLEFLPNSGLTSLVLWACYDLSLKGMPKYSEMENLVIRECHKITSLKGVPTDYVKTLTLGYLMRLNDLVGMPKKVDNLILDQSIVKLDGITQVKIIKPKDSYINGERIESYFKEMGIKPPKCPTCPKKIAGLADFINSI